VLFFLLILIPIVVDFAFLYEILSFAKEVFPYWMYVTPNVFFKDILFIEGATFIVFGALVGGVTLYNAWVPKDVRKAQFTEYIWNWKKIREERNFPTGLLIGLALIAFGVIYILIGMFFQGFPA